MEQKNTNKVVSILNFSRLLGKRKNCKHKFYFKILLLNNIIVNCRRIIKANLYIISK